MHTEILLTPTEIHLLQLKTWLKAEFDTDGEGYFCNWRIIERSFHNGEVFCIAADDIAVGFMVWTRRSFEVRIDICEIHPAYRRSGIGQGLVMQGLAKFAGEGVLVAEMECQPPTSEPFWKKMGFLDSPSALKDPYQDSGIELYRPLTSITPLTTKADCKEVLELWDCEPWDAKNKQPAWQWEIVREQDSTRLVKPIVFPCSREWNLRWRKNGVTLAEKKVKHFPVSSLGESYLIYTHLDAG